MIFDIECTLENSCQLGSCPAVDHLFTAVCLCHGASQGVKLLFYNSAADVLLLDIPSSIPNWFKPFYIGAQPPATWHSILCCAFPGVLHPGAWVYLCMTPEA